SAARAASRPRLSRPSVSDRCRRSSSARSCCVASRLVRRAERLVVATECIFAWYWLADLCQAEGVPFVPGHALYMKAIHGGKTKNDKIDAHKITTLLRG